MRTKQSENEKLSDQLRRLIKESPLCTWLAKVWHSPPFTSGCHLRGSFRSGCRHKLTEACPNLDWRVIVALSRYGGLGAPVKCCC